MTFWLASFSARGPARIRRSKRCGSFFMRYKVIASPEPKNTARKTQAC